MFRCLRDQPFYFLELLHVVFLTSQCDGTLLIVSQFLALLRLRLTSLSLLIKSLREGLDVLRGIFHADTTLLNANQLWSHKATVVIFTQVVTISRYQALQVDHIVAAIRTFDAFDLHRASDLDALAIGLVDDLVDLDVETFGHLTHLFVELLGGDDSLFIIHCAVLS